MTNRELLTMPRSMLGEVDKQRLFLLRVEGTPMPCPACKKPVRKIISRVSSPMKLKPLSISDAKKAGFTVLKKTGKGEYERQ